MTDINDNQVLRKALDLIRDPNDWGQGFSDERPGTYCAGEAIINAMDARGEWGWGRVADLVIRVNDLPRETIVRWNDKPWRTHAEVVAAFERAIEATS